MNGFINFLRINKYIIGIIIGVITLMSLIKACEDEPKIVTKTVTKIEVKRDTIKLVTIKEVPKIVYVNKYIDKQGEKVIVYVEKPTDSSTIKANQYKTELSSNNAKASLEITTSGELLDVKGVITYPKETITNTITKTKAKSGLFIFSQFPVNKNNFNPELGLMYQYKNQLMLTGSVQYNQITKSGDLKIGLGIKIF